MTDIATPFIKPPSVVVEDILEDIYLLSNNRYNTPIIPHPLEMPLYDSHALSFEHQLGLPTLPYIQGFHLPCALSLFLLDWSHIGLIINTLFLPFLGAMEFQASIMGGFIVLMVLRESLEIHHLYFIFISFWSGIFVRK